MQCKNKKLLLWTSACYYLQRKIGPFLHSTKNPPPLCNRFVKYLLRILLGAWHHRLIIIIKRFIIHVKQKKAFCQHMKKNTLKQLWDVYDELLEVLKNYFCHLIVDVVKLYSIFWGFLYCYDDFWTTLLIATITSFRLLLLFPTTNTIRYRYILY